MPRRVWIIAKKDKVEQSDIDDAILNGCPEIVNGIPPALQGIISEGQLPIAYEEPEPPTPELPRNLEAEIDEIKTRLLKLEPDPTKVRYMIFANEIDPPKSDTPIYVGCDVLEFNQELTAQEISDLETQLGKTMRKLE